MEKFYDFIDSSLPDRGGDKLLYKFKRKTFDEMTERANELTSRGLKDKNVISDLIISEHGNIQAEYHEFATKELEGERRKKFALSNIIGSVAYIFILVISYIGISMATQKWSMTWVMIVDGILIWVSYLLTLGINRVLELKKVFHIFARIMLAMLIVIISVIIFIFMLGIFHTPHAWVTVFVGLFLMFLGDGLFASLTKQRLAIFYWLAYIPSMAAMLYIILGGLNLVSWSVGWLMIPLSVIIDFIVIIAAIHKNTSYDEEVVDAWKEN